MARPSPPRLSVVLLTWNEERNIGACLASLARQRCRDFEVIVVDAASTDGTVAALEAAKPRFPVPLRVEVAEERITIGEARNRGAALARAPCVAFLSADAEAGEDWVAEALRGVALADLVFGRQLHAPERWGVAAAVRGLRYHHVPTGPAPEPARVASNVNAAARAHVLRALPFGTSRTDSTVDDLLLARRAVAAGYRLAYSPVMTVQHRDVDSARGELRKNLREGHAWGVHAHELGLHRFAAAWGVGLGAALLLLALQPSPLTALLALGVLWLPALRRASRRRGAMPLRAKLLGVLASPPFDLAFLLAYAAGLLARRRGEPVPTDSEKVRA